MDSKFIWLDGEFVAHDRATVPITTHAIHYGTSVFEGVRAYWNSENLHVFRLPEHIRRFRRSGEYYSMSLNFTDDQIRDAVINLCKKNKTRQSCYIRPFYFVGQHGINLHVTKKTPTVAAIIMFPLGDLFDKGGITAAVSSWRKFSDASTPTQAKMGGNYLNSIISTQEAKGRGFDEAILLDLQGYVSEAPGENIFVVKDGHLTTPPASPALDGITRDSILGIAGDSGYKVSVKKFRKQTLYRADEVFLCGTAAEITPVVKVDGKKIGDGKAGKTTKSLMGAYARIVAGGDSRYAGWLTAVY